MSFDKKGNFIEISDFFVFPVSFKQSILRVLFALEGFPRMKISSMYAVDR